MTSEDIKNRRRPDIKHTAWITLPDPAPFAEVSNVYFAESPTENHIIITPEKAWISNVTMFPGVMTPARAIAWARAQLGFTARTAEDAFGYGIDLNDTQPAPTKRHPRLRRHARNAGIVLAALLALRLLTPTRR